MKQSIYLCLLIFGHNYTQVINNEIFAQNRMRLAGTIKTLYYLCKKKKNSFKATRHYDCSVHPSINFQGAFSETLFKSGSFRVRGESSGSVMFAKELQALTNFSLEKAFQCLPSDFLPSPQCLPFNQGLLPCLGYSFCSLSELTPRFPFCHC